MAQFSGQDRPSHDQWVALVHIEGEHGFSTRYYHLQEVFVSIGDTVDAGQCVGLVGSPTTGDWPDHLHFEIRQIVNTEDPAKRWYEINTEPIDPTPHMYAWEKIYFERLEDEIPETENGAPIDEVGMLRRHGVPVFQVRKKEAYFLIPLVSLDPGEKELVSLLRSAFVNNSRSVRLATRETHFFGDWNKKIITAARVQV